jgi:predicted AlkP superfamily phosphohydrolase/phosphomutase
VNKLVIIGIDGMDYDLYKKWENELPNLKRLNDDGISVPLESIYPPDSICAWTTIFTGKDPSEHGLLYSINYLDANKKLDIDNSAFKGITFWDDASNSGKKVCIINPFLAYPSWPVNGAMFSGPVFIDGKVESYPNDEKLKYDLPEMGGIVDFPTKKTLSEFYNNTKKSTVKLSDFGQTLLKREKWDLFFITFLTLDRIKHFLWRYQDKEDPTYPGKNPFEDSIKNFYKLFDDIIGKYLSIIDSETNLMIISDHGHKRRSYRILNLNEYLRQKGYLISKIKKFRYFDFKFWIEKIKNLVLRLTVLTNMEDSVSKLIRFIPHKKSLKKSTFATDFNESYAYTDLEFAGKNPYCGIRINKNIIEKNNLNYDEFVQKLISDLLQIIDKKENIKIIKWVKKREEVYSGKYLDRFPEILIQLNENYGVDLSLYNGLISNSVSHRKISGGHKYSGVLFLKENPGITGKFYLKGINSLIKKILEI